MSIYTKLCTKCGIEKSSTEFAKRSASKDGLQAKCKSCERALYEANREKKIASAKLWQQSNKERASKNGKAWYEANKERHAKNTKRWKQETDYDDTVYCAKRRATKLQATPSWYEHTAVKSIYAQCKLLTEQTGVQHQVDHIVPLHSNLVCGLHCLANLQIIPAVDNNSKGNRYWPDMP